MAYSDNFDSGLISLVDSLEAAEKLNMSEMLMSKQFQVDQLDATHTVVTGVRKGNLIPILNDQPDYEAFPFVDPQACDVTSCDIDTNYSSHKWDLGLLECRVPICMRSFSESFNIFWNQYKQINEPNMNSAFLQFLGRKFQMNLEAAKWRAAYFGDTSSSSAYFDGIDGFFAQAAANSSQIVDIAKNDGATKAGQVMTGEEVYNTLEAMYEAAFAQPWFDPTQVEFRITRAMAGALVTWLNSKNDLSLYNCECTDVNKLTGARAFNFGNIRMFGIPVMVHNEWDQIIYKSAEFDPNGGTDPRVDPNRALLTYRSNLLVGTSETSALNHFDIWYSRDDKKVYMEGNSYIGAGIPLIGEYILAI